MLSPFASNLELSLPTPKQLETGEFDLNELVAKFTDALSEDSQRTEILQLTGDIAVSVIECLDKVISSDLFMASPDMQVRSKVFSTIARLSRSCQYLPRSYWVDPNTIAFPSVPHRAGGNAEVYFGIQGGEPVAVKVLRVSGQESTETLRKRFCREVIVWKHVSCPHVLEFKGVFCHNNVPAVVTPWMPHGNITEYLVKHPDVNRLRLFVGVVKGVNYLHNCNIAHGDIKGPNILISDSTPPRALLADFGFARISGSVRRTSEETGTAFFTAPELLHPTKFGLEKGVPSKEGDIYALGMTLYQVLTGCYPFYPRGEFEVIHAVIEGARPPRPENAEEMGMTEVVWEFMAECWREERVERPAIWEVLGRFCDIAGEGGMANSAIELAMPQLNIPGNSSLMASENPSLRTVSSSRGWDTDKRSLSTSATVPPSPFDSFGPEEAAGARGNFPTGGDDAKEGRPVARIEYPTGENIATKQQEGGMAVTSVAASPTDCPGCFTTNDFHTKRKRGRLWRWVKRGAARCSITTPLFRSD